MAAPGEEVRFATDSSLEGDGFEPSVPHEKQPFRLPPFGPRNSPSATKTGSFVPGTDGSNPSPSSGESVANDDDQAPGGAGLIARGAELHQQFLARQLHGGELLEPGPQPLQVPPTDRPLLGYAIAACAKT